MQRFLAGKKVLRLQKLNGQAAQHYMGKGCYLKTELWEEQSTECTD